MKVSVITVCFNSAPTIVDALRSVERQSHADVEHIVIDGASADGTPDLVRAHGHRVTCLVSEPDQGIYDAMNKGLALATGEIVGFLNSDDVLASPDCVSRLVAAFQDDTVDAVYGDLVFVDRIDTDRALRYWRPGPHALGACAGGWMAPHPTFYVRRRILQDSGGFDLNYRLCADFELMLRLFEVQRIRSRYLASTLVRMRLGGATTGSLRNVIRGNLEASRACRRHGFGGGPLFIARKISRRIPQFFSRPRKRAP